MYPKKEIKRVIDGYIAPFNLAGNIYFVGTYQASTHLIDTGDGLIIIDSGYSDALHIVIDGIHRLGFDPRDIKYIINTHWHIDHTQATAALADFTGAKTLISTPDAETVREKGIFTPDICLNDGDTVSLGSANIRCLLTPGHSRGTMSFFFDTVHGGKTYRAGTFGGAGVNSLVSTSPLYYEGCRADYIRSVERLMGERVDIFFGNHCWNNNTDGRAARVAAGDKDAFIDPDEWQKFLKYCKDRYLKLTADGKE